MKPKFHTINKILLWEPNWIGDVVLSLPLFENLHKRYPAAEITAAARAPGDEILRSNPYISKVELIPHKGKLKFASGLKKKNFDLAIILPNSFKSALLGYMSGATYRVGYNTEWRGFFLTHSKDKELHRERHNSKYYLDLLNLIDCHVEARVPEIFFKEKGQEPFGFLRENNLGDQDFLIALHPGASKEPRAWELKKFGLLSQELIKKFQAKIIVLGSKAEKKYFQEIKKYGNNDVYNATGNSLMETAALIQKCKLFIGNDSGIMHIAAAVNTPVVGIFGPGSKERTGPLMDNLLFEIVSKNFPCSPCRQKFFKECTPSAQGKPPCLAEIEVEDVLKAVKILLQRI